MKNDKKAVIYARYSSNKQTEDSIEAQVRACHEYADRNGLTILSVYKDEAVSGKGSKTLRRQQYQKMLKDSEKELFTTILIHKYDRIARNIAEHVTLEKRLSENDISLVAVAQDFGKSNESKILRSLVWAMSEYYSDNLADETRKGLKENALNALHTGGYAPFGYDIVDKRHVINDFESGYVRKMFQAATERSGFNDLIEEMRLAGVKGKRGKPIKYPQIYEILRNEKYTGTFFYSTSQEKTRSARRKKENAIKIENALPIIIDKALFLEVQKIMDERKRVGIKSSYLCSGLVYCSCGAKMHAHTTRGKGHEYSRYICSEKCGVPTVRMELVDKTALDYLKDLLSKKNQGRIADALREYHHESKESTQVFLAAIKSKIKEKQQKYDNLLANLSTGVLPASVAESVGAEMEALQAEISALEETEAPKDLSPDAITSWLEAIKAAPDDKAIHLLIERININQTTDMRVTSTLTSVVGIIGCGGRI